MSSRRAFLGVLGAGLAGTRFAGASVVAGQAAQDPPVRKVKTTPLFKSPEGYPNAIAVAPEGLWIAEQKTDNAHLVDWHGKVLKTIRTESKNTSGMGVGGRRRVHLDGGQRCATGCFSDRHAVTDH